MICLDTNSWLKERMLASQAGKALVAYSRSKQISVFRPGIVVVELHKHLAERVAEIDRQTFELGHERQQLLGEQWDAYTALTATAEDMVKRATYPFKDILLDGALSPEDILRAAERVIACRLPNEPRNQQFKDSLLWESLLSINDKATHFITADKNFYEHKDYSKGLASALKDELPHEKSIFLHQSVAAFLSENSVEMLKSDSRIHARLAHNLLFILGDKAMHILEERNPISFNNLQPGTSRYAIHRAEDGTISMQIQGFCVPIIQFRDGSSHSARLDVTGEAVIADNRFIPESILLKDWGLDEEQYSLQGVGGS